MDRVAVFVDAGYLFAAGSALLAGSKQPRSQLKLDEAATIQTLIDLSTKIAGLPLLRVYWYDGTSGRPSLEQATLGHIDNVKLRLGFINNHGQQKGVDSLIVIDLIELARNHAISDAVVVSGDEDIRVGVQFAQNYGVRVHLIGIHPARGSQSRTLQQEADSTHEIDRATIAKILRLLSSVASASATPVTPIPVQAPMHAPAIPVIASSVDPFADAVKGLLDPLAPADFVNLKAALASSRGVPSEFDGRLLAKIRAAIGRDLDADERSQARACFVREARKR